MIKWLKNFFDIGSAAPALIKDIWTLEEYFTEENIKKGIVTLRLIDGNQINLTVLGQYSNGVAHYPKNYDLAHLHYREFERLCKERKPYQEPMIYGPHIEPPGTFRLDLDWVLRDLNTTHRWINPEHVVSFELDPTTIEDHFVKVKRLKKLKNGVEVA